MVNSKLPIDPIYKKAIATNPRFAAKEKKRIAHKAATKAPVVRARGKKPISCNALGEACTKALDKVVSLVEGGQNRGTQGNVAQVIKVETPSLDALVRTRSYYMDRAKDLGIKNFRVLNKSELEKTVKEAEDIKETDPSADVMQDAIIKEIVDGAVARWKSGWKANKAA